jgi:predicted kinase
MPNLIITIGLPGSGKTTLVDAWVRQAPAGRARLARDGLRAALGHGDGFADNPPEVEAIITIAQHAAIRAWLAAGLDVAVDDTCQTQGVMDGWVALAAECGADLVVWDMRDVPVDVCVVRDAARGVAGGRMVGLGAICEIAARCAAVVIPTGVTVVAA